MVDADPPDPTPAVTDVGAVVAAVIAAHSGTQGPLLPVLQDVQAALGYLPRPAVEAVAAGLNLSVAEVHGVVSFYRDLRTEPAGRTVVRICRAEACQAVGARELVAAAQERLGVRLGGTTADGAVTLEDVFCLGNCALGPSVQIGRTTHGRVDASRFASLVAQVVS